MLHEPHVFGCFIAKWSGDTSHTVYSAFFVSASGVKLCTRTA